MKYIEQYIKENFFLQPLGKVTLQPDEDEAGWSGVNICVNNVDTNLFISHIDYATWLESKVNTIPKLESKVNTIPEYDNLAIKITHIENGYEYVDLNLPSGTLWATCNVGASKPWEYGGYYAFGEISPKKNYDWDTYLDGDILRASDCGTDKDLLQNMTNITASAEYDAAKVNWGGKWRMPTHKQQKELMNQCYWVWTDSYNDSNVGGYIVYKAKKLKDKGERVYKYDTPPSSYSLSDTHIFLPGAGVSIKPECGGGYYWSSSLTANYLSDAWYMGFGCSTGAFDNYTCRYNGYTIRPVLNQKS